MTDSKTVVEDLAAWLTQIWDEEERLAKAAPQGRWFSTLETGDDAENFGAVWVDNGGTWDGAKTVADWYIPGAGDHIAAHGPASVLARIAADRKILALHKPQWNSTADIDADFYGCLTCGESDLCETLKLLAEPYADRPGFRSEWLVERQGVEQ